MSIKLPSTQTIPFLVTYEPYKAGSNKVLCDLIDDMVSIDVLPLTNATKITYNVGAETNTSFTINVKNLTSNAKLQITTEFSPQVFYTANYSDTKLEFILEPEQTKQIQLYLNKDRLNSSRLYDEESAHISLRIKNLFNGELVVKNVSTGRLQEQTFPQELVVE